MKASKIEWTTHTFNPWWGCTKVSPGCANCYAETLSDRFGFDIWGPGKPRRTFGDHHWRQPLLWERDAAKAGVRARVFCASMADVFDPEAPAGALERLWALIRLTPNLDWQILTKRPERIAASLPPDWGAFGYPNVWLGTSVEDQKRADLRIPELLSVPARVRFLSCEPLLGPVDLQDVRHEGLVSIDSLNGTVKGPMGSTSKAQYIDWVIVGGESGHGARAMLPEWARRLREQTRGAGRAFFFKQWGQLANNPDPEDPTAKENGGDVKGGATFDGQAWTDLPAPHTAVSA